ncbi:MAG TPA: MFS transporter [Euzebya sp.]|nr:MFS transporter [Euzebya sp.]
MTRSRAGRSRRLGSVLVLLGILAVAANLRTAITVVGPLIPIIRTDTGASNVSLGLIGTIPVLMFGVMSPIVPAIGRRLGIGRSLAGSMVLLSVAIALRSAGGFGWLLVGTVLLGGAIVVGNVLLPALVKGRFPHRASQLTSAYTASMIVAATTSAGLAVPLATRTSWELAAGIWAVPAALGAVVVIGSLMIEGRLVPVAARSGAARPTGVSARQMYRTALAWQVTAFMGLQSAVFYVTIAWLPDILISRGMGEASAGAMVSLLNLAGLAGVLLLPLLHRGRDDQRRSLLAASACVVTGSAMLLVPGVALAPVATAVLGFGQGGSVGLALSFFALRTSTAADAAALSGMGQTWGYLLAALGPVAWGALRDTTGSWTVPVALMVVISLAAGGAGLLASRNRLLS